MSSTGSKMAGGNANQASAAGSAGKAWAMTHAAGAVRAVTAEVAATTWAERGSEP
ncbi:MAG: hypothetical protein MUO52_04770 [Desulfobacterales bacterium]|nr:hypothetical protein [Desulfobacterales bacterium]